MQPLQEMKRLLDAEMLLSGHVHGVQTEVVAADVVNDDAEVDPELVVHAAGRVHEDLLAHGRTQVVDDLRGEEQYHQRRAEHRDHAAWAGLKFDIFTAICH